MPGTTTHHKDLSVTNRIYGSLTGATALIAAESGLPVDAGLGTVTISGTVYMFKKIGTMPAGAVLKPTSCQVCVVDAFDDTGAVLLVGTCTSDFASGAVDPTGIHAASLFADADVVQASTGWNFGVAATMAASLLGPLAADTDVYIFYTDTAGTVISDGGAVVNIFYTHSNDPTTY